MERRYRKEICANKFLCVVLLERIQVVSGETSYKVYSSPGYKNKDRIIPKYAEPTQLPVICDLTYFEDPMEFDAAPDSSEYLSALSPQQLAEIIGVPCAVSKRKTTSSFDHTAVKRNKTDFHSDNQKVTSLDQSSSTQVTSTTNISSPYQENSSSHRIKIDDDDEEVKIVAEFENRHPHSRGSEILKFLENQWRKQEGCNVKFTASCGKVILAHKCVVSVGSPKFAEILRTTSTINARRTSFEVLREILRFMYAGKIDKLDDCLILDLLAAAEEFEVREFKAGVEDFLKMNLNDGNAIYIAKLATVCKMRALKKMATHFVLKQIGDGAWLR